MKLKEFYIQLSELYDEMKSLADEAVGGFAIDSPTPPIFRNREIDDEQEEKEKDHLEEKRVMIDFDKTINPYTKGWNDGKLEDPPYPDAKTAIDKLKDQGYEIFIYTTRASIGNAAEHGESVEDQIQNVKNYLINNGIYFDRITGDKLAADFYIDDKAVTIKNGNWKDVLSQIKKREKSI